MKRLYYIGFIFIFLNQPGLSQLNFVREIKGNTNHITQMAIDNQSSTMAFGNEQGMVTVLDYESNQELLRIRSHSEPVEFILFHPTSNELITADRNSIVINSLSDPSSRNKISIFEDIEAIDISAYGKTIYVIASQRNLPKSKYVYSMELSSRQIRKVHPANGVTAMMVSPSRESLYLAKGKEIIVYNLEQNSIGKSLNEHESSIRTLNVNAYDKNGLLSSDKNEIIYWNSLTGESTHMKWPVDNALLLSETKLLVQTDNGVKIRNYQGFYEEHSVNTNYVDIDKMICNEGGSVILILGNENQIEIWKNQLAYDTEPQPDLDLPTNLNTKPSVSVSETKKITPSKAVKVFDSDNQIYQKFKSEIDAEINLKPGLFAPRGEFEKIGDYESRMAEAKSYKDGVHTYYKDKHDRAIEMQRQLERARQRYMDSLARIDEERKQAMYREKIRDSYQEYIISISSLGTYDPDKEEFLITIEGVTEAVKVPIANAPNFKQKYQLAKVVVAKQLLDDASTEEVFNIKIIDPLDNNVYDFGKQKRPLYVNVKEGGTLLNSILSQTTQRAMGEGSMPTTIPDMPKKGTIEQQLTEYLAKKKYYALLIGVNNYTDASITQLDQPVNDALRLKRVLQMDYTFDERNIILLKNPTRSEIIQSFDKLTRVVTKEDNLLIFYAGHGIWDDGLKQGYWLPRDSKRDSKVAWLSNGTIRDYVGGIKSKHTLLIADACFSGGIFKTREVFSEAKAVLELYKLPSRKAMTSGNMKTVPDKSVFMEYLIKRLQNNEHSVFSAEQLFSSFRVAVINNSSNGQVPQYGDIREAGDEGGDFVFLRRE